MSIYELLLIAVALSADAFAISLCTGLSVKRIGVKQIVVVGLWFGVFQALMPLIGYFLGVQFSDLISDFDHWLVLILLGFIGFKMIKESFSGDEGDEREEKSLKARAMLPVAVATSIDALAAGVSFALLNVRIVPAVSLIGIVTFTLSAAGVYVGHIFGTRFKSKAEFAGGAVLILMGVKIVLEHMGII